MKRPRKKKKPVSVLKRGPGKPESTGMIMPDPITNGTIFRWPGADPDLALQLTISQDGKAVSASLKSTSDVIRVEPNATT